MTALGSGKIWILIPDWSRLKSSEPKAGDVTRKIGPLYFSKKLVPVWFICSIWGPLCPPSVSLLTWVKQHIKKHGYHNENCSILIKKILSTIGVLVITIASGTCIVNVNCPFSYWVCWSLALLSAFYRIFPKIHLPISIQTFLEMSTNLHYSIYKFNTSSFKIRVD